MIVRARHLFRLVTLAALALLAPLAGGCQSPSEEESLEVDDFLEVTAPTAIDAHESTDGRTYRVVRGNNQPDEILEFDWHTQFSISVNLNNNATSDDIDLEFPVTLGSAQVAAKQASGGIVSPPTGGEVEHYDSAPSQVSGNTIGSVGQPISMVYDVWYTMPSGRKEALITVTLSFADDDGQTFSKNIDVRVNP